MSLRLLKKEDKHEFKPILAEIEEDPGSPLGRMMFYVIVAVIGFLLLWTIFGEVDVVITARGKVIPDGQVKLVQPLTGGVVSAILVKEGDFVRKGQALIHIDPSTVQPALEASQKTLAHIQAEQARLNASAQRGHFQATDQTQAKLFASSLESLEKQLSAKEQVLENLNAQIQAKKVEMAQTRETLQMNTEREARMRDVLDIIPKDDYEKVKNEVQAGQNKLKALDYELSQLDFQKQQTREEMDYLRANFKSTALTELSEKEKQAQELEAKVDEATFQNARQTLTAPVDGYVHELFVHTVGGVVTPAQQLISIVPVNTPLMIESTVLNKDIGYVKKDMPVAIKIDTFEFQKYGTLKGKIRQVDVDSRENQENKQLEPVYTIYVQPLEQTLKVNGQWQKLAAGMSLTSEIKVGKRRIIEFFIYPLIKHLDEGMSVR